MLDIQQLNFLKHICNASENVPQQYQNFLKILSNKQMAQLVPRLKDLLKRTIGGYQTLERSSCYFSSILYKTQQGQLFLINKTKQTPKFEQDWLVYLMFKAYARTILTTGKLLREEVQISAFHSDTFQYDKDIKSFFQHRHNNTKQNVFILSNNITDQDVKKSINLNLYTPILIHRQTTPTTFPTLPKQPSLNHYLKELEKKGRPILFQSGSQTFTNYLQSQPENMIDMMMITIFEGELPEKCIGREITVEMEKYYRVVFRSEVFYNAEGTFRFHVYQKITK